MKKQLFVREELRVRRVDRSRVAHERVTLRSEDVRIDREQRSPNARAESGIEDYQSLLEDRPVSSEMKNLFTSIIAKEREHVRTLDRLIDTVWTRIALTPPIGERSR